MNIKEFKEWLNQFDDDVIVEVLVQDEPSGYESYGACYGSEFTGDELEDYEYVDFTGNRLINPEHSYFNKKILTLGMSS